MVKPDTAAAIVITVSQLAQRLALNDQFIKPQSCRNSRVTLTFTAGGQLVFTGRHNSFN